MKNNFKSTTKFLFLKYAIIPNIILFILFSIITILLLNVKVIYDTKTAANNVQHKTEEIYDAYKIEIESMQHSPEIIHTLETKTQNHLVYEDFYNFNNQMDVKSAFHLIDLNNVFLVSTTPSEGENNQKIINNIVSFIDKNPNSIYTNVERMEFKNGRTTVLNIGTAIKNRDKIIGYMVYQIYEDGFQNILFEENTDIVVITDDYDYIVSTTNSITSGLMNKFNPKIISNSRVKIKDTEYYLSKITTKDKMFTVYAMNNTKEDFVIYLLYFVFIIIIGIIIYVLLRTMAEKMSTKNVQSIEKLLVAVDKLKQGDTTSYVNISTGDEFEILADQYNDMLDSLNNLLQKNKELSDVRNSIEIKLLESQFNPHFVFNVLETLRYTMFMDKRKAEEIILSLSRILRYSLDDHTDEVRFEKDLNYMLDYLKLHKFRFGNRIVYHFNVDQAINKALVPKLLLQPLVENAIKYGYKNKSTIHIDISGQIVDQTITFKVTDNGGGIDTAKLEKIKKTLTSNQNITAGSGIGLSNTHRRLVLQYGAAYGLTISSQFNVGTEVTITLPYRLEGVK